MKNLKMLISVIVPIYNNGNSLKQCILSILAQNYTNLQIILIDDGSMDSTFEVSEQLAIEDRRIEIYHIKHGGSVTARKFGLAIAKGQYIGFVDADDYIEPNMYYELLQQIVELNADFIHSGHIEESSGISEIICNFKDEALNLKDIKSKAAFLSEYILDEDGNRHIVPSLCSKLFKAEFIKKCFAYVPDEQQYGEDLLCTCRCILECQRFILYKKSMYHYIIKNDSLSHMNSDIHMMKQIGLCYFLLKLFEEYKCLELLQKSIYRFLRKRMIYTALEASFHKSNISQYYLKNVEMFTGKTLVIFGAGKVGQDYYAQLSKYRKCYITAWVDSNWNKYDFDYADVIEPGNINTLLFDLIIIAVRDVQISLQIKNYLINNGVDDKKILWQEPGRYF